MNDDKPNTGLQPICVVCGRRAIYNVPRIGPAGGYLHEDGTFLCDITTDKDNTAWASSNPSKQRKSP